MLVILKVYLRGHPDVELYFIVIFNQQKLNTERCYYVRFC
jgi:hypothetical protein